MSIFEFDGGGGSGRGWNYAHQDKEGYSAMLTGDVVELAEVQSINFATKKPETWEDGNPKLNVCMVIMQPDGTELEWVFSPGGRGDEASMAMKAVRMALQSAGFPGASLTEIAGCNITVVTEPGAYNAANPRPWVVQINGMGSNPYRGTKKFQPQQTMQACQAPAQPQQPSMQQQPMQPQQLAQAAMQQARQVRNDMAAMQRQLQQAAQQPAQQQYQAPEPEYAPYDYPF